MSISSLERTTDGSKTNSANTDSLTLTNLYADILKHIFTYCAPKDLVTLRQVNKKFNIIANNATTCVY